ncbi:MAG: cation transporter [Saprospiraceae bacterium]|nr:cation transporter [Saprospiraceae bacterium]
MKSLKFVLSALLMGLLFTANAQSGQLTENKASSTADKTESFLVLGNCGMCKRTIEKAAAKAGASTAKWDAEQDQLTVTFNPEATSVDAIQKAVALSGYDNVGYKAPEEAYNGLPGCCQYDRSGAPSSAKSCEPGQGDLKH